MSQQQRPALATFRRPSDSREDQPSQPAAPPRFGPASAGDDLPLPKARERSISKSFRIPVSLLDQLETVCAERNLDLSALVLFYIAQGLRRPFASAKNEAV
jgi:hypothetical protein